MANHESFTHPRQEALTPEAAMAEFMGQHDERMTAIVNGHEAGANALNATYADQLDKATPPITPTVFGQMEANVDVHLQRSPVAVHEEINAAANTLFNMLPDRDANLLRGTIAQEIRDFGIGSHYVNDAIRQASSATSQRAIRTILDAQVEAHVQSEIRSFGVGSHYVEEAIRMASSKAVQQGIKSSLDAQVLGHVRNEAVSFGVGSRYVNDAIRQASSKAIRQAIKSTLDSRVLAHAQSEVRDFGVDSHYVNEAISHGSSKRARTLIAGLATAPSRQPRSESYTRSDGGRGGFSEDEFLRGSFRSDSFREGFRNARGYNSGGRQQPPRSNAPRPEAAPPRDQEVDSIVQGVASEYGNKGLLSEDPRNVRRVINTVRQLREQAVAKGEEVSDRTIYVRFRMKAQEVEVAGKKESTVPQSFQILQALMGGKPSGRIPF